MAPGAGADPMSAHPVDQVTRLQLALVALDTQRASLKRALRALRPPKRKRAPMDQLTLPGVSLARALPPFELEPGDTDTAPSRAEETAPAGSTVVVGGDDSKRPGLDGAELYASIFERACKAERPESFNDLRNEVVAEHKAGTFDEHEARELIAHIERNEAEVAEELAGRERDARDAAEQLARNKAEARELTKRARAKKPAKATKGKAAKRAPKKGARR